MRSLLRLMRTAPLALLVGACGYVPVPPDPIRYVNSPADVASCRRLGGVGFARTDGLAPYSFSDRTILVAATPGVAYPTSTFPSGEIVSPNFAVSVETMRDAAVSLGATDLLLSRRIYRDWSYAAGTAYRCPR